MGHKVLKEGGEPVVGTYKVGDKISIIVGWERQEVEATVLKPRRFRVLCSYGVRESWDGGPPIRHYTKIKWIWRNRIVGKIV